MRKHSKNSKALCGHRVSCFVFRCACTSHCVRLACTKSRLPILRRQPRCVLFDQWADGDNDSANAYRPHDRQSSRWKGGAHKSSKSTSNRSFSMGSRVKSMLGIWPTSGKGLSTIPLIGRFLLGLMLFTSSLECPKRKQKSHEY